MKVYRATLIGLNKFHLGMIFLVAVLIAITVFNNNAINNIYNFVNILELYTTKPGKNTTLQFRLKNSIIASRNDTGIPADYMDNGTVDHRVDISTNTSNFANKSFFEPRKPSSVHLSEADAAQNKQKLLIMILSGPDEKHEIRRQCVRSSYLSIEQWRTNYKHFFLIGQTVNETVERNIAQEEATFGDIVRYPGPDKYSILASKVMWGFQYIQEMKDPSFNLILKTDDDSFVNVRNVMQTFQSVDLSGDFYGGGRRFPGRKANVKKREMFKDLYSQDFQVPQHFCAGGGYFLSRSLMNQILSLHSEPPPAQVEDIYVGSLVEKLGVEATSLNVRTNHGWQAWWNKYYKDGLVLHYLNCKKMKRLYNQVKPV